jgi:hypothetical protein
MTRRADPKRSEAATRRRLTLDGVPEDTANAR